MNIPLMRYANVLLMKAEALNDLGRTGEAIPLINDPPHDRGAPLGHSGDSGRH